MYSGRRTFPPLNHPMKELSTGLILASTQPGSSPVGQILAMSVERVGMF